MQLASGKPLSSVGEAHQTINMGTSQVLAFTATSAQSAALGPRTTVVRLVSTQNVHVTVAATALADGTCMYLPLGVVQVIGVPPGSKIAAIRDSVSGNLFITEGQ